MPFNGINPRSVVLLDNASIHHTHWPIELIESVGALVHFIPPYSPDLDPVEELFSKVKACLKENDEAIQAANENTVVDILYVLHFLQQHQMTATLGSSMLGIYTETTCVRAYVCTYVHMCWSRLGMSICGIA